VLTMCVRTCSNAHRESLDSRVVDAYSLPLPFAPSSHVSLRLEAAESSCCLTMSLLSARSEFFSSTIFFLLLVDLKVPNN
jgi:hypothetical protein